MNLEYLQEIVEDLISILPSIGDLGVLFRIEGLLQSAVRCDVARGLELFEGLVHDLESLGAQVAQDSVHELGELNDSILVVVEAAENSLDISLLQV